MNVPYTEINTSEAAKRIGVDYSTIAKWCKTGVINCINIGGGTNRARYMLTDKEVEHLRSLRKKYGKRFIKYYNKDWDVPEEVNETECLEEWEVTQVPVELPKVVPVKYPNEENLPTRKAFNLDNLTTTISYMKDIMDRLSQIEVEKAQLTEKLNDIEAEHNQLTNEYAELREEVVGAL